VCEGVVVDVQQTTDRRRRFDR